MRVPSRGVDLWGPATPAPARAPRSAPCTAVIEPAVARGEVDPGVDVPLLAGLHPALALHHVAALGGVVDAALARRSVDGVLVPPLTSGRPAPD